MFEIVRVVAQYLITIADSIETKLNFKIVDLIMFVQNSAVGVGKMERTNERYLQLISYSLEDEWLSEADETAYGNL